MPATKVAKAADIDSYVKKLAANDRPTRDAALESITKYLSSPRQFDELDLLKLCKGLFFTMWFSDRPRTQQRLADDMANLLLAVHKNNFFAFLDAFWSINAREWSGIDKHRVDKFYMLLRRYVAATFRRLEKEKWDSAWLESYNEVMAKYPLNVKDSKIPNGLRLHMFDIYLDELERVLKESYGDDEDADYSSVPFDELLAPIQALAKDSPLKFIRQRAKTYVLDDDRLVAWGAVEKPEEEEAEEEEEEDDEWGGFE